MSDLLIEIEEGEVEEKVNNGQLTVEYYGSENTYYTDSEGNQYFCKNYPT